MKKILLLILCASLWASCKKEETTKPAADDPKTEGVETPPAEFADAKYTAIGKNYIEALSKGDTDGMMAAYSDDAKYYWNSGDSLIGKKALADL